MTNESAKEFSKFYEKYFPEKFYFEKKEKKTIATRSPIFEVFLHRNSGIDEKTVKCISQGFRYKKLRYIAYDKWRIFLENELSRFVSPKNNAFSLQYG